MRCSIKEIVLYIPEKISIMTGLTFCEKYKMMKPMDHECWICEQNIMNGGYCYPWHVIRSESEVKEE